MSWPEPRGDDQPFDLSTQPPSVFCPAAPLSTFLPSAPTQLIGKSIGGCCLYAAKINPAPRGRGGGILRVPCTQSGLNPRIPRPASAIATHNSNYPLRASYASPVFLCTRSISPIALSLPQCHPFALPHTPRAKQHGAERGLEERPGINRLFRSSRMIVR